MGQIMHSLVLQTRCPLGPASKGLPVNPGPTPLLSQSGPGGRLRDFGVLLTRTGVKGQSSAGMPRCTSLPGIRCYHEPGPKDTGFRGRVLLLCQTLDSPPASYSVTSDSSVICSLYLKENKQQSRRRKKHK